MGLIFSITINAAKSWLTKRWTKGHEDKVLAPVVGAFAEMSSDVHLLTDLIASAQAADHCEYFAALPSEIKACS